MFPSSRRYGRHHLGAGGGPLQLQDELERLSSIQRYGMGNVQHATVVPSSSFQVQARIDWHKLGGQRQAAF
jgi:hypothetical protein